MAPISILAAGLLLEAADDALSTAAAGSGVAADAARVLADAEGMSSVDIALEL